MAGWHVRLWRRVRVAPGVTVNLGRTGASVSVGPRGSKVTFGRRGVRQTVGIPGTGLYATRQLTGPAPSASPQARPLPPSMPVDMQQDPGGDAAPGAPVSAATADDGVELYYGFATLVGAVFGVALYVIGLPEGQAFAGAVIAIAVGIAYEGLAHHHPAPARALAAVVVAGAAIAAVVLGILFAAVLGGALASQHPSRRRR